MNSDDWTKWLEAHGAALVLFARQHAPCRADAEDIVQEAFVRFWRHREQATDRLAYLYTCVRRYAHEWRRGNVRRTRRESAVARDEAAEWFDRNTGEAERHSAIEQALTRLPESQREVVVLKIWGRLSFPQIAEALGIPSNTAASRYRYALDKMREQLLEESIR
jgi:RNA polymerase sigma-70 factor (ECF subfamily)